MTIYSIFIDTIYTWPIEFVTLEDGSEGFIIREYYLFSDKKYLYKFLDPFLPSDTIDITNIIDDYRVIITKSNRKFSIVENKLHVTDGLNKDTFQQMLKKSTYHHNNIYTLSIFKTIRNMLKDIVNNGVSCNIPEDGIKL